MNPTNKPEKIPGGFIIRGENMLDNGDALVKVIDEALKESPLKDNLYYYYIKDPTLVTEQQFENDDFEKCGVIVGLVGPRMNKNTVMESQELRVTEEQNTKENGYGKHKLIKAFKNYGNKRINS